MHCRLRVLEYNLYKNLSPFSLISFLRAASQFSSVFVFLPFFYLFFVNFFFFLLSLFPALLCYACSHTSCQWLCFHMFGSIYSLHRLAMFSFNQKNGRQPTNAEKENNNESRLFSTSSKYTANNSHRYNVHRTLSLSDKWYWYWETM